MLLTAARDYNIDLAASYMIGDSKNDVLAGNAAGCTSMKIGEGEPYQTLLACVEHILDKV